MIQMGDIEYYKEEYSKIFTGYVKMRDEIQEEIRHRQSIVLGLGYGIFGNLVVSFFYGMLQLLDIDLINPLGFAISAVAMVMVTLWHHRINQRDKELLKVLKEAIIPHVKDYVEKVGKPPRLDS